MSHFIGEDILKAGINKYFTKYKMQNTELKDFLETIESVVESKD